MATDDVRSDLAHLYRRAGFGARPDELDAAVPGGYDAAVERLADFSGADTGADAVPAPTFSPPLTAADLPADPTARRAAQQQEQKTERAESVAMGAWWVQRMVASTTPLRERLTLFWHGHFATSVQKVRRPELMYRQNQIFRSQGAGSFPALVQSVVQDPAMLIWLDANDNRRESPNENLARELFELFVLGIGNYSEDDIKNAARALTGLQYRPQNDVVTVAAALHDPGAKTLFGQTGPFAPADVVRLATSQPASPVFVAARLWSHLAYPVAVTDPVARELGASFAKDGDVGALVRAVLHHPQFRSDAARQGLVKEPIVYVAGALRAFGLKADGPGMNVMNVLDTLGQQPLNPPNVGGWPQNGYWLTTSFALTRLRFASTVAARANLGSLSGVAAAQRPAALARILSVDEWGKATAGALSKVADDPKSLVTLGLVSPEYVLA